MAEGTLALARRLQVIRRAREPKPVPRAPTAAELGRAIRLMREARRMSIEGLAFAADMHPNYLGSIERGHSNPTWNKVGSLAAALGTTIYVLVRVADGEAHHGAARNPSAQNGAPTR